MLKELLMRQEGKTLEFKENTQGLQKIIQTIVAFANTAGGTIVIGIKDKTKEIVGVSNILQDEEKTPKIAAIKEYNALKSRVIKQTRLTGANGEPLFENEHKEKAKKIIGAYTGRSTGQGK